MSFHQVSNISIKGISTCVPNNKIYNSDIKLFKDNESAIFSKNTGINSRYVANEKICTSDLCFKASESLLEKLNWKREEVDILIFISQTSDYILPATSNILQNRLGLSKNCVCLDINLGCSGYIYGMSLISNLLQNSAFKKGLLLVGDTISKLTSKKDKSVYPLFGDAGTATALEYDKNKNSKLSFILGSDGSGEDAIKITHGGGKNSINEDSLKYYKIDEKGDNEKRNIDLYLNGVDVFNFAIKTVPKSIITLLEQINIEIENIDYFVFHQANLFIIETIRKKLKISPEKLINSINEFGNTNGASIPLTICKNFPNNVKSGSFVICGFGVGLSWGALYYKNEDTILTDFNYLN